MRYNGRTLGLEHIQLHYVTSTKPVFFPLCFLARNFICAVVLQTSFHPTGLDEKDTSTKLIPFED